MSQKAKRGHNLGQERKEKKCMKFLNQVIVSPD